MYCKYQAECICLDSAVPVMMVNSAGTKEWRLNGQVHRTDGPAIEYANGDKIWYRKTLLHREHGPAIENANGSKQWWINGELHRDDGPAVEWADGRKEWWLNGNRLNQSQMSPLVYQDPNLDTVLRYTLIGH